MVSIELSITVVSENVVRGRLARQTGNSGETPAYRQQLSSSASVLFDRRHQRGRLALRSVRHLATPKHVHTEKPENPSCFRIRSGFVPVKFVAKQVHRITLDGKMEQTFPKKVG